jgi:eukaryotic-like serine/threonine-protein kinase
MMLEPGTLLVNRYRIVEILGQGGMGSVYRAIDEHLDIDVAVKDNSFTSDEYSRQFRREATILATLRHKGLPRVTDYFVIKDQSQYLVMDYIEGEDLRQRMERAGTVDEEEAIVIGAAICDSLIYLGSRIPPIIHRDIKPGNVKIAPNGHIFLVDFGLAKEVQGSQVTTSGARAMTPGFSPPEQYGTARTDLRTDVFSLGATLYAAVTGVTPEDSLARAMGQATLTPVRKQNSHLSRRLATAIEKSLELLPDKRYQTPEEFKGALLNASAGARKRRGNYVVASPPEREKVMAEASPAADDRENAEVQNKPAVVNTGKGLAPSVPPTGLESREIHPASTRANRLRRATGCVVELILTLIILILGIYLYSDYQKLPSRLLAAYWPVISTYLPLPTASLTAATTGTPLPTSTSQQIAAILPTSTSSLTSSPTLRPATPSPTVTPVIPSATATVPVIPLPTQIGGATGEIAFASQVNGAIQIFIINADGSNLRQITNIPEGACQPDFSPDGKRIVFTSPCDGNTDYYPHSSLYTMNIDGSGFLPLSTLVGGDYDPAWAADGSHIAFTSLRNNNRPGIYVLDLQDQSVVSLAEKYAFDSQPAWSTDGKQIAYSSEKNGRHDIWVMDADGQNRQQLTSPVTRKLYYNPSWSANGAEMIMTMFVSANSIPQAMIMPIESENYEQYLVGKENRPMRDAVISPDGFWIAFESWESGSKHNIYIITTTGINIQPVTDVQTMAFDPVWMPSSHTP